MTSPPGAIDAVAQKRIAAASALVPGPSEPGVLAVERIARSGGTDEKPAFDVTVDSPTADPELFLEGPSDWFAGAPKKISDDGGRYTYRVTFDRLGAKTPIAGSEVRVTIVSGDRAVEQTVVIN